MRRILVALFGHNGDKQAMAAALDIANRHGGHVTATHVAADPYESIPVAGEGMSAHFVQSAIEAAKEQGQKRAEAAKQAFEAVLSEFDGEPAAGTRFSVEEGRPQQVLPRLARTFDMTVIGGLEPTAEPTRHIAFEALLFASGRPILLVPASYGGPVGKKAVIGWNDTPEATHAVGLSLDLLRAADSIDVLTVDTAGDQQADAANLGTYLEAHGIAAKTSTEARGSQGVTAQLLDRCGAVGADLLIIGGYGHSRIGEIIFGGVTHDLLQQYNVPVLMAH